MTPRIADDFSTLVAAVPSSWGEEIPPRDPNNHDDDEDEDEDEDEDDEKQPDEPAVVREPDDDE